MAGGPGKGGWGWELFEESWQLRSWTAWHEAPPKRPGRPAASHRAPEWAAGALFVGCFAGSRTPLAYGAADNRACYESWQCLTYNGGGGSKPAVSCRTATVPAGGVVVVLSPESSGFEAERGEKQYSWSGADSWRWAGRRRASRICDIWINVGQAIWIREDHGRGRPGPEHFGCGPPRPSSPWKLHKWRPRALVRISGQA